jgi:hypothetical protein
VTEALPPNLQQHVHSLQAAAVGTSRSCGVSEPVAADAAAVDLSGVELQLLGSSIPAQLPQRAESNLQQQVDSCNLQLQQQQQVVVACSEATNVPEAAATAEAEAALAEQASEGSCGSIEAAVQLSICRKGCAGDTSAGSKPAVADEHAAASVAGDAAACDEAAAAAAAPAAVEDEWAAANRQRLEELQQQVRLGLKY